MGGTRPTRRPDSPGLWYHPAGAHPEGSPVQVYVSIVQIIVSLVLIFVVLLQTRGAGFSATFSSDSSIYRSRRGVEKTLFNFTIGLAVLFVLVSIVSVMVQ
jgi:preprotein translocase subunit SecG